MQIKLQFATVALFLVVVMPAPAMAGRCQFVGVEGGEVEVNTDNGSETAGKTGMLKCYRDGKLWREQELRNGEYIGLDKHYDDDGSVSEREINANGNTHGRKREFYPGGKLESEAQYDDGAVVGLSRSLHANGQVAALRQYPKAGAQPAVTLEFNDKGQLTDLRCATTSLLAEDKLPCGFDGRTSAVDLFDRRGNKRGQVAYRDGKLLKAQSFDNAGHMAESTEFGANGRIDRRYYADGQIASERKVENDYVIADSEWYMNGKPKSRTTREPVERDAASVVERFRDTGVLQTRERWRGRHRQFEESFDEHGKLSIERSYDDEGRLQRQRKFSADGAVVLDEAFYPDGSRKASGATVAQ